MNQNQIERLIHPKHIQQSLHDLIQEELDDYLSSAVRGLRKWLDVSEYDSKNARKEYLKSLDLHEIVTGLFTTIGIHCINEMPYVSIASMYSIPGMSKLDSIKTVSELIALFKPVGLYEITTYPTGTRTITSLIGLPDDLANRLNLYCYLPPMIEKPDRLENNKSSGYKTINKDSLILGHKENYHNKSISLDVLNTLNKQEYVLDTDFMDKFDRQFHREELEPNEIEQAYEQAQLNGYRYSLNDFTDQYNQDRINYENYMGQLAVLREHIENETIYFTHKVDKRGRVYSQGFHFHTQGSSYEKACLNLKKKELCTGEL